LYALHPQAEPGEEETKDEGEDGVGEGAHKPHRGAVYSSSPVQIYIENGYIAGNYIREDVAYKFHVNCLIISSPQLQMCVVLLVIAN
jgi:hypothetical protein